MDEHAAPKETIDGSGTTETGTSATARTRGGLSPEKRADVALMLGEYRQVDESAMNAYGLHPAVAYLSPHAKFSGVPIGLKCSPTPAQAREFEDAGYCVVWQPASRRHPHLLLNTGRGLAELEATRLIIAESRKRQRPLKVLDVGSNADRLRTALHLEGAHPYVAKLHHMIPQQQFGDTERLLLARGKYPHCTHMFEECECCLDADVVLFQHSMYYVDRAVLLERYTVDALVLSTLHHITSAYGRYFDEASWFIRPDGMAEVSVKGNSAPYVHAPTGWLTAGFIDDWTSVLSFDLVGTYFHTRLYQGRISRKAVRSAPVETIRCLPTGSEDLLKRVEGTITTVIKARALGPGTGEEAILLTTKCRRLYLRYGMWFYTNESDEVIVAPFDFVGALAARMSGVPRDGTSLRMLFEYGKRLLLGGGYPPNLVGKLLTVAVPIALVLDLESEAAQLAAVNQHYGPLMRAHAEALAGRSARKWRWYHHLDPRMWWATCCNVEEHHGADAATFQAIRNGGYAPVPIRPVTLPAGTTFPPTYSLKGDRPPPRSSASFTIYDDLRRPPPPPGVRLVLIAPITAVPTTAENTAESVEEGFWRRMGREVPQPVELVPGMTAWDMMTETAMRNPETVLGRARLERSLHISPGEVRAWIDRFPENLRESYYRAQEELVQGGLRPAHLVVKTMIKVEKSAMCLPGKTAELKPRLVNARSEVVNLVTGPTDKKYAGIFRKRFDPSKLEHLAVWVNGAGVKHFGAWTDAAIAACGGHGVAWVYWGDEEGFEVHRPKAAQRYTDSLYTSDDPDYQTCREAAYRVRGRGVRLPVEFSIEEVLCSGGTDTSIDSANRNLAALRYCFGEPHAGKLYFAFNGDDWLVISTQVYDEADYHARQLDLGFEGEFNRSRQLWDVEFCQSLPYPVNGKTVWAPKIGRVLGRLPYATTATKDDPRGVAKGMLVACAHVPFLRQYLDYIVELCPDVKAVKYEYHVATDVAHECATDTWAFVGYRYGLAPLDLEVFVAQLREVKLLGSAFNWEHGLQVLERDD